MDAQRKDGDYKGSWDPNGTKWIDALYVGRVMHTVLLCLCLEFYNLYKVLKK